MIIEMDELELQGLYERRRDTQKKEILAVFTLAGIEFDSVYALENRYWPPSPKYHDVRTPWYLIKTKYGFLEVGWRKNVLSISWDDTKVRALVTTNQVTKNDGLVHAWSYDKAVEYLKEFKNKAEFIILQEQK